MLRRTHTYIFKVLFLYIYKHTVAYLLQPETINYILSVKLCLQLHKAVKLKNQVLVPNPY